MDYSTRKEKFNCFSSSYESNKEQPIDIDITLPDYCPDVRRVLKCKATPQISMKTLSGDTITVDGNVNINILYCDSEKNTVRCYEHNTPFSCSFNIKNPPSDYIIFSKAKTEYINCRALTSRRLDLHGAFNVNVKMLIKEEKEIIKCFSEEDLEQQLISTDVTTLNVFVEQQFSISETTPLSQGKSGIQSILQKTSEIFIDDVKLIPEKAMVKGFISVKLLYISEIETGKTENFEYTIPFNQIVDIQGGNEKDRCFIKPEISYLNISSLSENDDNSINTDVKFSLIAILYSDIEVESVKDAYSIKYEVNPVYSKTSVSKVISEVNEIITEKSCIEFNDKGITSIIDLWADKPIYTYELRDGKPVLKGKVNINVLCLDNDNEPFYAERTIESIYDASEFSDTNTEFQINSIIQGISYRLNGNSGIELRVDIKLNFIAVSDKVIQSISSISAEKELESNNKNISLVLYYSHNGEDLWDIAKKYKITKKAIKDENELTQDKTEGGLLILPV